MAGRKHKNQALESIAQNHGLFLSIYSVTAQTGVAFKGFLTSFRDNFNTQLEAYTFIGHPQPYRKQKTTERSVELSFDIPAYGLSEARENLVMIGEFVKMLHPVGRTTTDGQNIVVPGGDPMFKIRFLNLLADSGLGDNAAVFNAQTTGVRGYIDALSYEFVLDADGGGFIGDRNLALDKGAPNWESDKSAKKGFMYPKLIRVSFTFYPFETKPLLWIGGAKPTFSRDGFPYLLPKEFIYIPDAAAPSTTPISEVAQARLDSITKQ